MLLHTGAVVASSGADWSMVGGRAPVLDRPGNTCNEGLPRLLRALEAKEAALMPDGEPGAPPLRPGVSSSV